VEGSTLSMNAASSMPGHGTAHSLAVHVAAAEQWQVSWPSGFTVRFPDVQLVTAGTKYNYYLCNW
jgi:hypothetical protein